jgi:bacterioferritin
VANKEARKYCEEVGDYVTKNIFEALLTDEEGHVDFLETQLDLLGNIGPENYAQLNASKMDEAD